MALELPHPGLILTLVGYFGLLFLTTKLQRQRLGPGLGVRAHRLHGLHPRPDHQPLSGPAQRRPDR
ncbi:MAG: hypothetical protein MZV63_40085 [Marinilabiliales bacterium]|nr:hypothetical protein [Marinilabiliales bacterium]